MSRFNFATLKFRRLKHEDRIDVDVGSTFRFECCDCSLVHTINVQVVQDGRVRLRVRRDDRETAKMRVGIENE